MNNIKEAYNKGYRCTKEGILLNPECVKIGHVAQSGYYVTSIRIDGKYTKIKAHRLQAFQKFGDEMFKPRIQVRHLNANKLDFSYENIEIGTPSQNMMDKPKEERLKSALNATSSVRKYDKTEVRAFYDKVRSYKQTMENFNISSKGTLHFILNS
jgi:hypothetical protein